MELKNKPEPNIVERMHQFANVKSGESIILTLSFETTDQRYARAGDAGDEQRDHGELKERKRISSATASGIFCTSMCRPAAMDLARVSFSSAM